MERPKTERIDCALPSIFKRTQSFFAKANGIWLPLIDQAIVSASNFLTTIILAAALGPSDFGTFSLFWLMLLFLSSIQIAIIISPLQVNISRQSPELIQEYLDSCKAFNSAFTGLSMLAATICGMSANLLPGLLEPSYYLLFAITAGSYLLQDYHRRHLYSQNQIRNAVYSDIISYIGQLSIIILLNHTNTLTLHTAFIAITVSSLLALAPTIGLLKTKKRPTKLALHSAWTVNWQSAKWLTASSILQWSSGNFFLIAASTIIGPNALGVLRASQNIMGLTHVLFQTIENSTPMQTAKELSANGKLGLARYITRITIIGLCATGLYSIVVSITAPSIMTSVYGKIYGDFATTLIWYAAIYPIVFMSIPIRIGLRVLNNTRPIFISYALSSIVSLTIAQPLISLFGIFGVLYGIAIVQILIYTTLLISFLRTMKEYASP